MHVAAGGTIDLANGVVRGSEIGACVQNPDFRVERLSEGVAYVDNGTNLDVTTLPTPEPSDPVPEA